MDKCGRCYIVRVMYIFKYLPQVVLEAVTIAHPGLLSLSWDEPTCI